MLTREKYNEARKAISEMLQRIDDTQDSGGLVYELRSRVLNIAEVLMDEVQFHYLLREVGITDDDCVDDDAEYEKEHPLEFDGGYDYEG